MSALRDLIASNIDVIGPGLRLIKKEAYIPNVLGTNGFIDLYAIDDQSRHVLIELRRSDSADREAIHELHKYVEGVKQHLAVRDEEIGMVVASTTWRELAVPFSRFVADSDWNVRGVELLVDEDGTLTGAPISLPPLARSRGR